MKVIFLKDVPGTGRRNDVKEVNPGYATNFLLPNKLAVSASEKAIKKVEHDKTNALATEKIQHELQIQNLEKLSGKTVTIREKANDEGNLFKGVNKKEILAALEKQLQVELSENSIILDKPIKEVGDTKVKASAGGKTIEFTVATEKE